MQRVTLSRKTIEGAWTLDLSRLTDSAVGTFICKLRGPAQDEAMELLWRISFLLLKASVGGTKDPLPKLLGATPIQGRKGVFEIRSKNVRVYFAYDSKTRHRIKILGGGLKTTQIHDIKNLR